MPTNRRGLQNVIDSPDELLSYLKNRGQNHRHYKYYGSFGTISSIVSNRCLLLSRGNNWNDTEDRRQFQTSLPGYVRFGTCLSYTTSENVAMWMLYGGTQKDGAMIDLRQSNIRAMTRLTEFHLGRFDRGRFALSKTVSNGCQLYPLDVLYVGLNDDDSYAVKRSNESIPRARTVPAKNGILIKSYPWSYEYETRLVLDVPETLVDDTLTHAWIPLESSSEELLKRAYLAPNSVREDENYQRSTLRGKIDWDICNGCTYRT